MSSSEVRPTVLFMCPYGGAKSVIAASYFNRAAEQNGLQFRAIAAAAEEPYDSVPPNVAEFLTKEGFDVTRFKPRRVDATDLAASSKRIAIDCDLAGLGGRGQPIDRWDDVPKVSVDLAASAAAIKRHVGLLVNELRQGCGGR